MTIILLKIFLLIVVCIGAVKSYKLVTVDSYGGAEIWIMFLGWVMIISMASFFIIKL